MATIAPAQPDSNVSTFAREWDLCAFDVAHEPYPYHAKPIRTPALTRSPVPGMTDRLEELRDHEYPQLKDQVYLDHAGTTLCAKSAVEAFSADLVTNLYGNPHSESSPSALAGLRIDRIREQALRFFNADPKYWDLVFVANATAAIKLAAECMQDYAAATKSKWWYGYHKDAHTSLVGSRQLTGRSHCFKTDAEVERWIGQGCVGAQRKHRQVGLFAFPGQSNMTGRRLPLDWCAEIKMASGQTPTYVLLDAAALATTTPLTLDDPDSSPDFVALSFYKIFGFPNIGALLVQKNCKHIIEKRRYFGGGTVEMVVAVGDKWHAKKDTSIHDQLEDGTLPFTSIFALGHAIDTHERLYGPDPMSQISRRTAALAKHLHDRLTELRHRNGKPVVHVYKDPESTFGDSQTQGATVAMNVMRANGTMVGYTDVEKRADRAGIYLRSGSLCNPGGFATYLEWSPMEMKAAYTAGHRCSSPVQNVMGKPTGVVRVSLGAMSTVRDIETFIQFVHDTYLDQAGSSVRPSLTIEQEKHVERVAVNELGKCSSSPQHSRVGYLRRAFERFACPCP